MPPSQRIPLSAWTVLLDHVLDELRQGGVSSWPTGRWPRLKRRLEQQWLGPIWGTWGDQVTEVDRWPSAVHVLIQWACGLVRPDHRFSCGLNEIPESAWVEQTAWRPLLAAASTAGILSVPELHQHYRRNRGESALDNLCGFWAVGASTTYRYVDRGRRLLAEAVCSCQTNAQQRWALRDFAATTKRLSMPAEWHSSQAQMQAKHGHVLDAAWHLCRAALWQPTAVLLKTRSLELASTIEYRALCQLLRRTKAESTFRVSLLLGESLLWSCLGETETEFSCLQLALRTAEDIQSDARYFLIGESLYALGYFYNAREPERAISNFEAAAQQYLLASQHSSGDEQHAVQSAYVTTIASLAFVHLRRNSPQGKALLHSAMSACRECPQLSVNAQCVLLKAQAEDARCCDLVDKALQFRQQALVLYQRVGDLREVIESHNNLGQLFAIAGHVEEAKKYCQQVIKFSQRYSVRPETLLSAYGGLALTAMTLSKFESAVDYLLGALHISQRVGLPRHELASLINLAEVHFLRFKNKGNAEDVCTGDMYAEQARSLAVRLGLPQLETKAQSLKKATLNPQTAVHHLLPIETSAHPGEFAKIEALRAELALPRPPAQRARTHIALSQLYLRIAAKERDAARGLMQTHGLSDLESELEGLQQTWAHDGNLASQLNQRWREQVGDWLTDAQRKAVLARLLEESSLSKSSYGEAAEVSPATASKHLGLLADKGLLEQQGRGPATRYVLPAAASESAPAAPPVH